LAIQSILSQDYSNFELIITDNASEDSTRDICVDFAKRDSRVRYVANPRNLGAGVNHNRGVELARGEFLKWCAHDDMISANFVSACISALQQDPGAVLAFGRTQNIDLQGAPVGQGDKIEMEAILSDDPAKRFHDTMAVGHSCFAIFGLIRTEMLRKTTLHRSYYGSDRALIAELALLGRCLRVDSAMLYNREHPLRSIRIQDRAERSRWQDTTSRRSASMEHTRHLLHLIEIGRRHPDVVRPRRALLQLAKLRLTASDLWHVVLDVARFVAPKLVTSVRSVLRGPRKQMRPNSGAER
jgi:glycosyltransferase involved in cell wall biosynthesis